MTCIVGIADGAGNVWLGGDRAVVSDRHYLQHTAQPKVFRRGHFLMGYTSSFRMGQLLQYRLASPDLPTETDFDEFMATTFADAVRECLKDGGYTKVENCKETAGSFLVGVQGRLYYFDEDYNVHRRLCNYTACGSGESVALGSLYSTEKLGAQPVARIRLALEASSEFVTTVRPPFDVLWDGPSAEGGLNV